MRLVEKEHELRLFRIADLGQAFEQFGQKPQQESRIQPRRVHQLVRRQNADPAKPAGIRQHQIGQLQRRFAEQPRPAFVFQHQQPPLDRADRIRRNQPVAPGNLVGILRDIGQQRLQVLQVQKRQLLVIRQPERHVHHAFLRLGQLQQP